MRVQKVVLGVGAGAGATQVVLGDVRAATASAVAWPMAASVCQKY